MAFSIGLSQDSRTVRTVYVESRVVCARVAVTFRNESPNRPTVLARWKALGRHLTETSRALLSGLTPVRTPVLVALVLGLLACRASQTLAPAVQASAATVSETTYQATCDIPHYQNPVPVGGCSIQRPYATGPYWTQVSVTVRDARWAFCHLERKDASGKWVVVSRSMQTQVWIDAPLVEFQAIYSKVPAPNPC